MKELDQILQLWRTTREAGEEAVLATVVKTAGSSYRNPGARLLLTRLGVRAGSISGGCLEDDLVKKAWWLTEEGGCVRRYDTTPDGEIGSGYGLGCNGIIHVMLQRLKPGAWNVLDLISEVRSERRPAALAHAFEPTARAGRYLRIDTEGACSDNLGDTRMKALLEPEVRAAMKANSSRHLLIEGNEFFVETLEPAIRLLIFGAGDDAVPLANLGRFLGWSVSVLDGRAHYARRDKFPGAAEVVVRQDGDAASRVDAWTVAVLMSHSYSQDLAVLSELAAHPPRYLGILGPDKRGRQLLEDAGLDRVQFGAALHSPVGLDIGADGPEQVALAIASEIQGALSRRDGGQLRSRGGPIHDRQELEEDSPFRVRSIVCA